MPRLKENDAVAILASPEHFSDFMFHLRRRVVIAGDNRGGLAEESLKPENAAESKKWFLNLDEFVQSFNARQRRLFCLLPEKDFPIL